MKRLISVICLAALMLCCFGGAVYATEAALADQESVIGSYADSTLGLSQVDCGYSASSEIYPSPDYTRVANPTSYTFLMINMKHYSGQVHPERGDMPLDDNFFYSVRTSFENARRNGVMLGIRFRFDDVGTQNTEPDWDNMIEMFLDIEESGILEEYADILVWCEMGTLGAFGEQWGTRYGDYGYSDELIDLYLQILPDHVPLLARTTGRITHWVNSKLGTSYGTSNIHTMSGEVSGRYADFVNDAPRYVNGKASGYHSGDDKDFSSGKLLSCDLARLGLYNDGYMGTNWDYGTYGNRENETAFLNGQSDVVYGGEFSGDRYLQIYYGDYTTVWYPINAIPEMYYTNLAYLHSGVWGESKQARDFDDMSGAQTFVDRLETTYENIGATHLAGTPTVTLQESGKYRVDYTAPGFNTLPFTEEIADAVNKKLGTSLDLSDYYGKMCNEFISHHMGYRFVVRHSAMTGGTLKAGDTLDIALEIENTGFHKINMEKELELILVNGERNLSVNIDGTDLRTWDTGTHTLKTSVTLPAGIAGGKWQVYLRVSAPNDDPAYDNKYTVKFANADIYNAALGANIIGEISVEGNTLAGVEYVDPRDPGLYYDEPVTYPADTDNLSFLSERYEFTTDGKYGYTVMFKVDGIEEGSDINLTRWFANGSAYSGSQLHSFNWFFKNDKYGYGKTFTENGYYLMYCPFYSLGAFQGPSVAGSTYINGFSVNYTATGREDKDTPTSLNGNAATITPLGIYEGAATAYDVTFHYDGQEYSYTGTYAFTNTDRPAASSIQFKTGEKLVDLYEGQTPKSYYKRGIPYKFVGWTTAEGLRAGLVGEDQIAVGKLDLYPYYEPDLSGYTHNAITEELVDGVAENGMVYTLDHATRTACVGIPDSLWSGSAGFVGAGGDLCEIPAYVVEDGVYYTVTSIAPKAFAANTAFKRIIIPTTVTDIAADAFDVIKEDISFYVYADSTAADYARAQGIECEAVSECTVCAVVFRDADGTILEVSTARKGGGASFSDIEPDGPGGAKFKEWDKPLEPVNEDTVFTAVYDMLLANYTDLDPARWYAEAVEFALQTGLMNGVSEDTFSPDGSTTRGMFVTVVHRLEGSPEPTAETPFTDVEEGRYYSAAVAWAYENEVVNGITATTFEPDSALTREQFVTILYRYAENVKGYDVSVSEADVLGGFADADEVSAYAQGAVIWACHPDNAFVTGLPGEGGTLLVTPKGSANRAMMATILYRFIRAYTER